MPTWAFAVLSVFDVLCAIVAILGMRKSYRALRECRESEARQRAAYTALNTPWAPKVPGKWKK